MAEVVTGDELKVRVFEARALDNTTLQPDQRVAVDGPTTGPGSSSLDSIVAFGTRSLASKVVPPGGFPVSAPARIPVVSGTDTALYDFNELAGRGAPFYLGPFQFPPITNNQGGPLVAGNTYYNTSNLLDYVFSPAGKWVPVGSGAPAALKSYYYFPSVDGTTIPINGAGTPDQNGNVLEFNIAAGQSARDSILVFVNGALLVGGADYTLVEGGAGGDRITLFVPYCGGAVIMVQVFGVPGIVFASAAVGAITSSWVFNGVNTAFPIRDAANTPIIPGSSVNCLLVVSGRVLNPMADFSVLGSTLTFATAPPPGESVFLVVGLPIGAGV